MKLRVLIADDHAILREGLALLIQGQPDMVVIAQASNGREAVQLARQHQPEIALVDISMPELGGVATTEQIREHCPGTRVVALTRHSDPAYVRRVLQAGATGYVLKKSAADALIDAIRTVAQGHTYVEPSLAGVMLQRAFAGSRDASGEDRGGISEREEEVLRSIAWGRSNKEIASVLGISVKTVESYKASALEKLQLRNRADIVRHALGRGWLTDDTGPE